MADEVEEFRFFSDVFNKKYGEIVSNVLFFFQIAGCKRLRT